MSGEDDQYSHLGVTFGFGVSFEGRNLVVMLNNHEVIYSLGKKLIRHNISKNTQITLPATPRIESISSFQVSPNSRYVAVCEVPTAAMEPPQVSILDLESNPVKRARTLLNTSQDGTTSDTYSKYTDIDFSFNSKMVVAISNEPSFTVVVWDWFRSRRVGAYDIRTPVDRVRFNPFDSGQVSTSGNDHLRLWKVQENVLKAYPIFQGLPKGMTVTDHTWTLDDRLIAVSDRADLYVIDEGVVVQQFNNLHSGNGSFTSVIVNTRGIIVSGSDGMIVLIDMVAEKKKLDGRDPYKFLARFKAVKEFGGSSEIIYTSLAPKGGTMICAYRDNFGAMALEDAYLTADGIDKNEAKTKVVDVPIQYVFHGMHTGEITDIDTCVRKPLVVTCSRDDQSVRLWNFRTKESLAVQTFTSESQRPLSVAIDPSGNIVLVCFSGRIQMFLIHLTGLKMQREIICRGARKAYFSHGSGMFVVACGKRLDLYQTFTGKHLGFFQGHAMPITSVHWKLDDLGFISCGLDGAVYDWKVEALGTNTRSSEHHAGVSGLQFDVVACGNHGSVVTAGCILPSHSAHPGRKQLATEDTAGRGSKGPAFGRSAYGSKSGDKDDSNKRMQNKLRPANTIIRGWKQRPEGPGVTIDMPSRVLSLLMCGHVVYIGLDNGTIVVHEWPFEKGNVIGKFPVMADGVQSMKISRDGQFLFCGSKSGVMIMLSIKNRIDYSGSFQEDSKLEQVNFKRVYLDERYIITDMDEVQSKKDQLNDVEAALSEVEGGHRVATELMKTKHAELLAKIKAEHGIAIKTLEEQESNLKKLLKANENQSSAALKAKEDRHMKTAKMLEDLYERKLATEATKIQKLNGELRDALIDKSDIEFKYKLEMKEMKEKFTLQIEKLSEKRKRERKQQDEYAAYIKSRYEEVREKSESEQDIEVAKMKLEFENERTSFDKSMENAKGEMIVLRKQISMVKEALDHEEERSRRNEDAKTIAMQKISDLEKFIAKQKLTIESLGEDCKTRDRQIKIHMRKVGELERVRHVLQHQLHEARGELEPMDREVEAMRERITELNDEYKKGMRGAGVVQQQADAGKRKVSMLTTLVRKHESSINSLRTKISDFSRDVEKLITQTAPQKWADGVLNLYEKYVVNVKDRGGHAGPDKNTVQEFNRQRAFMERSVKALKRETLKATKSVNAVKKKAIVENAQLMHDLNQSRHDARRLHNEVETLKSELLGMRTREDMRKRLDKYSNKNRATSARPESRSTRPGTADSFQRPNTAESAASYNTDDFGGFEAEVRKSFENAVALDHLEQVRGTVPGDKMQLEPEPAETHEQKQKTRTNALSQLSGSRSLPRPASSVMLRSQQRPKSGGRPYTASERQRMLHGSGASLAKSMGSLQRKRALGSPEKILLELETSEMQNVAQGLQIEHLRERLSSAMSRTQLLENALVSSSGSARMDVGGRVRKNRGSSRPKTVHGQRSGENAGPSNAQNSRRPGTSPGKARNQSNRKKNRPLSSSNLRATIAVGGIGDEGRRPHK